MFFFPEETHPERRILLSATFVNHVFNHVVQVLSLHQLFYGYVHAVMPVIERVSRNVDSFALYIFAADLFVNGCPVLKTENAEHRPCVASTNGNRN